MTDALDSPAVRFCWCPPMQDPNDPDQHERACAHAAFVATLRNRAEPVALLRHNLTATAERPRYGACRKAPWGWVHVKPGCRCPR